ncbi:uncharacterized protein LOC134818955 isoform X2 [Bolinopsis microptera]|uniref:uncharacterized protein LOC134818955 isoform X2 n=1 Tax=Bolinopsis microptera TaxID=2820187 RepID=UPI00307A8C1B
MRTGYTQRAQNRAANRRGQGRQGSVKKIDYPHPKALEVCFKLDEKSIKEGVEEGEASADPFTIELKMYLEMKGFPHKIHIVDPEKGKNLPEWFRKNNWDGVLPMTKYDKEQYKLGSAETMMALEKKFCVPSMSSGGMGAGRFRGKTVKNLTLSLLKSVRPYDDTNPDWKDLVLEFKELDQYLVQCHGREGDYMKSKKFSLWDIRMVPALYNLVTIANYFKPGFALPDEVPHLRSYLQHAFEDPVFKKFCPTVRKIVRYYEPKLNVRIVLPDDVV